MNSIPLKNELMSEQILNQEELIINHHHSAKHLRYKRQVTQPVKGNRPGSLFTYIGALQFGTPAVTFSFLFDSGSTKTWIKDRKCNKCGGTYDTDASKTFALYSNSITSVAYADGTSVSGPLAQDTISMNDLTIENYTFILATSEYVQNSNLNQYDGISGFGPTSNQSEPTLFSSIFQSYPDLAHVISYYIDDSQRNGGITVGGIDTARFSGRLAVQDIVPSSNGNKESFSLRLDSIKVGKSSVSLPSTRDVLIDTGTSLTILPLQVATEINQKLNFIPLGEDFPGLFGTYCPNGLIPEGLPNLTIYMGNVKLKITPDIYTFFIVDQGTTYCVSGIQGTTSDYLIIGNVFLRRYYTVFDLQNKRIGFATCNRQTNATSSIIAANLSVIVTGNADPNSVFGETSSESCGNMIFSGIYGMIMMICMHIVL